MFFLVDALVCHQMGCGAVRSIRPSSENKIKQFSLILGKLNPLLCQSGRGDWAVEFNGFSGHAGPKMLSLPLNIKAL